MTEDAYGPNLPNIFELAFNILNNFMGKEHYKQVINQACELISIIMAHQKIELTEGYVPTFIGILFANRENMDSDYFMQAWQRVCIGMKMFTTDLNSYYPILLECSQGMFNVNYSDDDIGCGLTCLSDTLTCFKTQAEPFVSETMSYAKGIF